MSMAVKYAMKKKAKKMAEGGETSTTGNKTKTGGSNPGGASTGGMDPSDENDDMMMAKGGDMMSKKQRAMAAFNGKKMADGGPVDPIKDDRLQSDAHMCDMCGGSHSNEEHEHDRHDEMGEPMMAEGGQITDNYNSPNTSINQTHQGDVDPQDTYVMDHEGNFIKQKKSAMMEDNRKLNQHGADEMGPEDGSKERSESYMGNPGNSHDEYQDPKGQDSGDLISNIMSQRRYSKGGMVANEDQGESASIPDQMAKSKPNEMDDLALRDDLEFSYDGANSGDDLGNHLENQDRDDIIERVLKDRAMKAGRLPKSLKGSGA